jgi:putative ABC transport system permease protein
MTHRAPRLAEGLLRLFLADSRREFVMGDLEEEYRELCARRGRLTAGLWYWRQVVTTLAAQRGTPPRTRSLPRAPGRPGRSGAVVLPHLGGDVRFAFRSFRRSPVFTLVALGTLTLGIGANTAIFTVVDSVVLRQLPYDDPENVVAVWPELWFSQEQFVAFQEQVTSFEAVAAYSQNAFTRTDSDPAELVMAPYVTADFLSVLRGTPELGRTFVAGEDRPGAEPVVILTHGLWQRELGGDPGVLGSTLILDGTSRTIVGVLPVGFDVIQSDAEVVVPFNLDPSEDIYSSGRYLRVIGRLREGVSAAQAQEEVRGIAARWREELGWSDSFGRNATVVSLRDQLVAGVRPTMFVLLGAVGLTLLIACANVANLSLARGLGRRREIAVRIALGADRRRVIAQMLTESVVLACGGGVLGFVLATLGVRGLVALIPPEVPRVGHIHADWTVLGFALAVAVVTGLAFGLLPAVRASRPGLGPSLTEGGRSATEGTGARLWRSALVVTQVAVAVMLVIGAGLLIESFWRILRVDSGIEPRNLLTLEAIPPYREYRDAAAVTGYYVDLVDRLATLPGVVGVGAINVLPIRGAGWIMGTDIEGREVPQGQSRPLSYWRVVTPGYREAVGMRLLGGRDLADSDRGGQVQVALINETMARQYWPDEDPIGKRFRISFEDPAAWITVVGVVADVRHLGLNAQVPPTLYRPQAQAIAGQVRVGTIGMSLVIRTTWDPAELAAAVRRQIRELDPGVPVVYLMPMEEVIHGSLDAPRFTMLLLVLFAATALVLGTIGVYGVMSYDVSEQRHEIGIRIALGASPGEVVRMIVRKGLLVGGVGVGLGLLGAFGATRAMSSLLFGVGTTDLSTFSVVPLVVLVVAAAASFLPARRASGLDPMTALRLE